MGKLDIDVLVSLVLYGPAEANGEWPPPANEPWPRRSSSPDVGREIGEMLWRMNADNVLDPEVDEPLPVYTFERLPCPVTAVEGLKALACYRYQTADDANRWRRSEAAALCRWLQGALIRCLPGFREAPWGWTAAHVDARLDRARVAALRNADPHPPPPQVTRVLAAFAAHEVDLVPYTGVEEDPPPGLASDFHDELRRKTGHWVSGGEHGLGRNNVHVRLFVDDAGAHAAYLARRARHEHIREWPQSLSPRRVARYGPVVVELSHPAEDMLSMPSRQGPIHARQDAAFAQLGEPDEHWSNRDRPTLLESAEGTIVARHVALPPGYGRGVLVARDGAGLERIASLLADQQTRQQVLTVDLTRQTVLMIAGIADADHVSRARMYELASPPGQNSGYLLELTVEGARDLPAVVVAIDRLPEHPTETTVHHPDPRQNPTAFPVFRT